MINYKHKTSEAGFTLVELAISMLIVGILFAAVAFPYSVWLEKRKFEETTQNVEQMAWVVSAFRSANGYYPCPAPMDAPRDSKEYGYQTDCSTTTVTLGSCSATGNKYCVTNGARSNIPVDLDYDITTPDVLVNPKVRIGTIPFRELNMPEEFAYDAYGNRILYAVTEGLAWNEDALGNVNLENHPQAGGIDIIYKDNYASNSTKTRLDVAGSANFTVLSHGPDKVGGYNLEGNLASQPCDESSSDGENCDHVDGSGFNAIFYISETVTNEKSDDHHDDVALFQLPLNAPLWARSTNKASNIYSIKSENNPTGQVGSDYLFNYYTDPAHPTYSANAYDKTRLWVGGNIKVEAVAGTGGQAQAFQICDRDGGNCFKPEIIGGAGIQCAAAASAMKGVIQGNVDCESLEATYKCPGNQIIRSINNGVLDCVDMPCVGKTVTSCSQSFSLPNAPSGGVFSFSAGDSYKCSKGRYTCTDGAWTGGFKGMCTCTPSVVPFTRACPSECTSGILTYEKVTDCPNCRIFNRSIGNTCVCPPKPCVDKPGKPCKPKTCEELGTCPKVCPPCTPGTTGGGACPAGFIGVAAKTITTCSAHPVCTSTTTIPATCVPDGGIITEPPCEGGVGPGCP